MLRLLIAGAVALATLPSSRARACSMVFVDLFTNFDAAARVARVEVLTIDEQGTVMMRRIKTLKGAATGTLSGKQGRMCPPSYTEGQDVIAFFDATGVATWYEVHPKAVTVALTAWQAAKTPAARARLLQRWAKRKDAVLKVHAAERIRRDKANRAAATQPSATQPSPAPAWSDPAPGWKSPGTAAAAAARFTALWPAINAAVPTGVDRFADVMTAKQPCASAGHKTTAAAVARELRDVGSPPSLLLGTLDALDALGTTELWATSCGVGFWTLSGYLHPKTGALVVLWSPPEG